MFYMIYTNLVTKDNAFVIVENNTKPQKHGSALATLNKIEEVAEQIIAQKIAYSTSASDAYSKMSDFELLETLKSKALKITTNYKNKTNKKNWLIKLIFRLNKKNKAIEAKYARIENMIAPPGLFQMPNEVLLEITKRLDFNDLGSFAQVNRLAGPLTDATLMDEAREVGYTGRDLNGAKQHLTRLRSELDSLEFRPYVCRDPLGEWEKFKVFMQQGSDATVPADKLHFQNSLQKFKSGNGIFSLLADGRIYRGPKFMQFLSKIVADLNVTPNDQQKKSGKKALGLAARFGEKEIVEFLLRQGIDVHAKDKQTQNSALHEAAKYGHVEVIDPLLKHGADINARDSAGKTPLALAVLQDKTKVVEALIKKGADINTVNNKGNTPLIHAIETPEIVRLLLEAGATQKIDQLGYAGSGALHLAIKLKQSEVIELLLIHGANINLQNGKGQTPLAIAKRFNKRAVPLLLANGARL